MNTGGPAFPMPMTMMTADHIANEPEYGMTLRDYFAAKAMQEWVGFCEPDKGAVRSYEWADAMLKARDQ